MQRFRRRILGALTIAALTAALPAGNAAEILPTAAVMATAASSALPQQAPNSVRAFAGALPTVADERRMEAAQVAALAAAKAAAAAASAKAAAIKAAAAKQAANKRAALAAQRAASLRASRSAKRHALARAHERAVAAAERRHALAVLAERTPGEIAVSWARRVLGRPYVWGATGPDAFDCSGLTAYAWAHAGVWLDHYTGSQYDEGRHIDRSNLRPGDLVFFGGDLHHVGIYIGDGMMIAAPHTGSYVQEQSVDRSDYVGAVRPG